MIIELILAILLLNPASNAYLSDNLFFDIEKNENVMAPQRINHQNVGVKITAERFVALDVESGKILLQKDASIAQPIASITKLMTALVILAQNPDWQKIIKMEKQDETWGAQPHIYRGEEARFIDLWKASLITSDNNAIKAMIRSLEFSEEEFVEEMNKKAQEMEMYNTKFADPTGLSKENISTALDVSRLLHSAMQKNEIRESVLQGKYNFKILNTNKIRTIFNTDILIDSFLNKKQYGYELIGGKTGFLPEAGYCLAAEITHESHIVIIVVLDSAGISQRFQDVKAIADWVYTNYQW